MWWWWGWWLGNNEKKDNKNWWWHKCILSGFAPDSLSAFETFTCSICVFYKLYFGIVHVFFCPFHTNMCIVHMVFLMCISCICTVSVLYSWSMHVPCNCKICILSCTAPPTTLCPRFTIFFLQWEQCIDLCCMRFNQGLTLIALVMYNFCRTSASRVGRGTWLWSVLQKIS